MRHKIGHLLGVRRKQARGYPGLTLGKRERHIYNSIWCLPKIQLYHVHINAVPSADSHHAHVARTSQACGTKVSVSEAQHIDNSCYFRETSRVRCCTASRGNCGF